ncbi:hypothetical protein ACFFTM_08765 [Pseudoduganella plicata]|uniref:Uncharacterized protein n=2 Tax=Pseudoduganella plicata TaxID=321984 RepID=A0ABX5S5B6_9BURK|nr:hypothetical protein [Pseudoduganella plicata]QBQ35430.1 hypothetical protein E1742_04055 [Pseudoduganella plicata]
MPLPIAGAMTAAAGLGRMAGAAMQTAMTAARGSRLAPAFQQLANKLRTFDPAMLATLLQPGTTKPPDMGRPPPLPPRRPGGALAAALRDAVPSRPTLAPPKHPAAHTPLPAMPPPSPRPSVDGTMPAGGELTPLLARAWDHLETTLRGLTSAVVGGRAIGEEMLAIIGPRLRALNDELAPLLQKAGQPPAAAPAAAPGAGNAVTSASDAATTPPAAKPAAAKPAAAPPLAAETGPAPATPDGSAAAAELLHALTEAGERNAMDLVGAQPAAGDAQPAHGHAGKASADTHAPALPVGAATQPGAATTPAPARPPAGASQPGVAP